MNLTFRVDAGGLTRKLALLTSSVRDVEPVLRQFDKLLALKVRQRFAQEGPGWPPLSDATQARRAKRVEASKQALVRKLGREAWRTEERQARRLAALDAAGEPTERKRSRFAETLRKRLATVVEMQRHIAGEATGPLSEKLAPRAARAEARGKRPLGRLSGSFTSSIRRGVLTRESTIPWAGVHNEGGTAGHGAKIPARPFLFLEEDDADTLVEMLRDRMLVALED